MLGAIVGDIIGSPYEYDNIKTKDFPLYNNKSYFTDDTVMTIAVGIALRKGGGNPEATREALIDVMHEYGALYPTAGYGGHFGEWVLYKSRKPYNSFGNGSAMRVSSAGWLYDTLEDVERFAEISAAVTHNHPEGIKGAKATAAAIFLARSGKTKNEIYSYLSCTYKYDLSFTLDEIRPSYTYDVTCQGTVPQAVRAFLESVSFEDAIRNAISIGGDSDTVAAITGGIAEAFYGGIPPLIWKEAQARLDDRLRNNVKKFQKWIA